MNHKDKDYTEPIANPLYKRLQNVLTGVLRILILPLFHMERIMSDCKKIQQLFG